MRSLLDSFQADSAKFLNRFVSRDKTCYQSLWSRIEESKQTIKTHRLFLSKSENLSASPVQHQVTTFESPENITIVWINQFLWLFMFAKTKKKRRSVTRFLTVTDCPGAKADCINLLLALPPAGFLTGPSDIRVLQGIVYQRQTRGWKVPAFGWATFRLTSWIIDNFV